MTDTFENILINKYENDNASENEKSLIFNYFKEKNKEKELTLREKELTIRETSFINQFAKYLNSENKNVILF